MVTPRRFERPTYRLGICRSILLSYGVIVLRNQPFGGLWRNAILLLLHTREATGLRHGWHSAFIPSVQP